jgi:hypothetical protein
MSAVDRCADRSDHDLRSHGEREVCCEHVLSEWEVSRSALVIVNRSACRGVPALRCDSMCMARRGIDCAKVGESDHE